MQKEKIQIRNYTLMVLISNLLAYVIIISWFGEVKPVVFVVALSALFTAAMTDLKNVLYDIRDDFVNEYRSKGNCNVVSE